MSVYPLVKEIHKLICCQCTSDSLCYDW